MSNDSSSNIPPIAFSFKEFRDEEIVEFFANENRSFHPEIHSGGGSRSRVVGAPHFAKARKATAAFQSSLPFQECDAKAEERQTYPGRETPASADRYENNPPVIRVSQFQDPLKKKRKKSIEPSFGKPTRPLGTLVMMGRISVASREGRAARIVCDPLEKRSVKKNLFSAAKFDRQPPLHTGMRDVAASPSESVPSSSPVKGRNDGMEESLNSRFRKMDEQLRLLVDSWPKLSPQLKETIAALVEVAERDLPSV